MRKQLQSTHDVVQSSALTEEGQDVFGTTDYVDQVIIEAEAAELSTDCFSRSPADHAAILTFSASSGGAKSAIDVPRGKQAAVTMSLALSHSFMNV